MPERENTQRNSIPENIRELVTQYCLQLKRKRMLLSTLLILNESSDRERIFSLIITVTAGAGEL